nr:MaoC family dehydratase [Ktedonobacteraceae bacterium]
MSEETQKPTALPAIGARATRVRTITDDDIVRFAEVSGDRNPVHLDADYAARSPFGQRIAHGFLTGSMISALIGMELPGAGSIYLGQTLKFLAPVHIGDTVTASVEVVGVREEKRIITLRTDCTNQDGILVLTGEAVVKYGG